MVSKKKTIPQSAMRSQVVVGKLLLGTVSLIGNMACYQKTVPLTTEGRKGESFLPSSIYAY
jgi:hypothetical protein